MIYRNVTYLHDDLTSFASILRRINTHILNNTCKHIHFQYHHAFGHNIAQIECLSRAIPGALCVIFLPLNSNHFIPHLYNTVNFIAIRVNTIYSVADLYTLISLLCRRFIQSSDHLSHAVTCGEQIYHHIRSIFSFPLGPLNYSSDTKHFYPRQHHFYEQLLYRQLGPSPRLPQYLTDLVEHYLLSQGLVDFHNLCFINLRFHGSFSPEDSTSLRDSQLSTHTFLARYIADRGRQVILHHDPKCPVPIHPRIFSFYRLIPPKFYFLLSLYLLVASDLYIGAHSGPIVLRGSAYQKSLICDSFPFYLGSLNQGDTILSKNLLYHGDPLSLRDCILLTRHREAFLSSSLVKDYKILPNTTRQLVQALELHLDHHVNRTELKSNQNQLLKQASLQSSPLYFHQSIVSNLVI